MAGIFKNLDASDIRLTAFQTHKQWYDTVTYKNYYSNTQSNPISVSGLYGVSERAFATDLSSSLIIRLDPSDDYTVLGTYTVPSLSGSRYGNDVSQTYIAAFGRDVTNATITMLSPSFVVPANGTYTSSVVEVPYDVSYNCNSNANSYIFVAGKGGISGRPFNPNSGVFFGTEVVLTNLADQSLTSSFYAINAESKEANDKILAISVTPTDTYAVIMTGSYTGNDILSVETSESINAAVGIKPKTLLYNNTQDLYFLLMQNGFLYKIESNASSSLLYSNVADILQDRTNYISGSTNYQSVQTHIVYETGQVGIDFVVSGSSASFEKIVDARQWVSQRPIVKASIQLNDPSGSIGVFAGTVTSLSESVFFTVDPRTYQISDPVHMGATKGDLRIGGNNLARFVGFSSSYSNRFVEFNTNLTNYQHYKADYNPIPSHPSYDPLNTLFDQGNPHFQYYEPITANGKFQRVVHKSVNHLFFQHFYDNTKATFGGGNINLQNRFLEDQAHIINLPQTKFGESIQQGSVLINANYLLDANQNNSLTIVDDLYGNLYVSGGMISSVDGTTLVSESITKITVGEWPTLDIYKYNGKGPVSFTSSFNKGDWRMESRYNNVTFLTKRPQFGTLYGSGIYGTSLYQPQLALPYPIDLLGVVPEFSSSLSSSITIQPGPVQDYKYNYNFENGDFTITMMIQALQTSSHASGSILIAKQGTEEDTAVDINGNTFTYAADNRSPYRVWLSSSYEVVFERDNLFQQVQVSGSIREAKLHHLTVMKTGSELRLYVDGTLSGSAADLSEVRGCSNKGPVTIGNLYTLDRGFDGVIDNVKIYNKALTPADVQLSYHTLGHNSTIIGTIMYNHGMMVLSGIPARFMDIEDVRVRGTHTIWEKEISCTVSPGEFNRSNNPTLQVYNPASNQYEFRPFTTASEFKPYVTSVGLYDDKGRMVAIGKMASPLQLPNNTDTTIIVRFDT